MTDTDTLDGLHRALDARPEDQALRLIMADWYDEHDDPLAAECLRWMARLDRYPDRPGEAKYYPPKTRVVRGDDRSFNSNRWAFWIGVRRWNPTHAIVPSVLAAGWPIPLFSRTRRGAEEIVVACWKRMEDRPHGVKARVLEWEPRERR